MTTFTQSSYNVSSSLRNQSGDKYFAGESVENTSSSLYDQTISDCTFYLSKVGSPSGNIIACVYDRSTDSKVHTFQSLNANDNLTTSAAAVEFSGSGFTLTEDHVIGLEVSGGDNTNYVKFHYQGSDVFDSTNSIYRRYDGSTWTDQSSEDAAFILVTGSAGSTLLPPPVAWI